MEAIPQRPGLAREQKLGLALLGLFGVLAVGLGVLQMRNTIYGPFVIRPAKEAKPAFLADERVRLQQVDTDHDGINDYEELQTYGTSPYLPDTDSDGVKDAEEIQKGADPNCAEGKECESAGKEQAETQDDADALVASPLLRDQTNPLDALSGALSGGGNTNAVIADLLNNPQALRQLLLGTGKITEAQLQEVDDTALLRLADSFTKEKGGLVPPASTPQIQSQ